MNQHDHKYSFVRILRIDGKLKKPCGAGFLVTTRHVLTCAHVISDALAIPRNSEEKPKDIVSLDFPLLEFQPLVKAKVIRWFSIEDDAIIGDIEDIAVLELLNEISIPDNISPVPVFILDSYEIFDRSVRMCGFPYNADEGKYINGKLQGFIGKGWVEVQQDFSREMVDEGFSGTAVWDKNENAVLGMLVSLMEHSNEKTAYMIPIKTLIKIFPDLNYNSRPLNPYKGLEAFKESDASFFFGREKIIEELLENIQKQPFIAVLGPSGSGKSSLIAAGIIPKLKDMGNWIIASFRPKNVPFDNLSLSFIPYLYEDKIVQIEKAKNLTEKFIRTEVGLEDIVNMMRIDFSDYNILIFVDQFEELFTSNPYETQKKFIELVLKPFSLKSHLPLTFLFTLRSDFLSIASEHSLFANMMNKYNFKILTPMSELELISAIEKPLEKLYVKLEAGLSQRIVQELTNEPGSLPLLQFALTEMWKKQKFKELTHTAYDSIGGVNHALSCYADTVYESFTSEESELFWQIIVQLVRPGEGTEDTRQVALRHHFNDNSWTFIRMLADARLVVTGRNENSSVETVEIVHEALIKNWEPLKSKMFENRSFRLWQNNLRQTIAEWKKSDKNDDFLLRGGRLEDALEKLENHKTELSNDELSFISTSVTLKRKKSQKIKKYYIFATLSVTMFILIISALGIYSFIKSIEANKQKLISEQKTIETLQKGEELKQKLIDAQHNLGLFFFEKANYVLSKKNYNETILNLLHALFNLSSKRDESKIIEAESIITSEPSFPIVFSFCKFDTPETICNTKQSVFQCFEKSPDDLTLAVVYKNVIKLIDIATGKTLKNLISDTSLINNISFSPDGHSLASGDDENKIIIWNIEYAKDFFILGKHRKKVNSVCFSNDGKMLASGSDDKSVILWNIESKKEIFRFEGHEQNVNSVVFSPDGNLLASGGDGHKIILWDVKSGKVISKFEGHNESINCVRFSPDGKILASSSGNPVPFINLAKNFDNTIRLWNVKTGKQISKFVGHTESINCINFSSDGKYLISASGISYGENQNNSDKDNTMRLWDINTGNQIFVITGHTMGVKQVDFLHNMMSIISLSKDGIICWDISDVLDDKSPIFRDYEDAAMAMQFSPHNNKQLAWGSLKSNYVFIFNNYQTKIATILKNHKDFITSISFSPNGKFLASGSRDRNIVLTDIETKNNNKLQGHDATVLSLSFSNDEKFLSSGGADNKIILWDTISGNKVLKLKGHKDGVKSVIFSPVSNILASGGDDRTIILWNIETGKEFSRFEKHTEPINCLSFSPDGKLLASGASDKNIIIWDVVNRKLIRYLSGHEDQVNCLSFSPDGKYIASGSGSFVHTLYNSDNSVRVWEVNSGNEIAIFRKHNVMVNSVCFSKNGKILASAAGNFVQFEKNFIRFWNLSYFHDTSTLKEKIKSYEMKYNLKIEKLSVIPKKLKHNKLPVWSNNYLYYWIEEAKNGNIGAMKELASIYEANEDDSKAIFWYDKLDKLDDQNSRLKIKKIINRKLDKAVDFIKKNNYLKAINICTNVIQNDPTNFTAYYYRAYCYYQKKMYQISISDLSHAIEKKSDDSKFYRMRASCYLHINHYDKAIADYKRSVELKPNNYSSLNGLGWILLLQKKFSESIGYFKNSLKIKSDFYPSLVNLGHVYLLTKKTQKAKAYYLKAIKYIKTAEELNESIIQDLELFIKKEWKQKLCKTMIEWVKNEFFMKNKKSTDK